MANSVLVDTPSSSDLSPEQSRGRWGADRKSGRTGRADDSRDGKPRTRMGGRRHLPPRRIEARSLGARRRFGLVHCPECAHCPELGVYHGCLPLSLSLVCLWVVSRFLSVSRYSGLGSVGGGARARGGDEHFTSPPTSDVPPRFRKRTLRVSATESDSRGAPRWGEEGRAAVLENERILGGGGRRSSWSGGRSGKALGVVMALISAGEAAACSWGYRKVGLGLGGRVGKSAPSGRGGTSRRPGTGCALGDEVVVPQRAPDWAQCLSCVVEDHAAMVWST